MNNELVLIVDAELAKSLRASARTKPGCLVDHDPQDWREGLKDLEGGE